MITSQDIETIIAGGGIVYSTDGNEIGSVREAYFDADTGEPVMVRVSTGISTSSESFVPLREATMDDNDLHVPYTKEQVKDAPSVNPDGGIGTSEQDALYRYYHGIDYKAGPGASGSDAGGAARQAGDGTAMSSPQTTDALIRSEERLNVRTRTVETERVRLRKYIVTEEVTLTVPVRHEEFRLEREPVPGSDAEPAGVDAQLNEEEHEIVLYAERPVVQMEIVPVERIRVRKHIVPGEETIHGTIRKEQIDADVQAFESQAFRKG